MRTTLALFACAIAAGQDIHFDHVHLNSTDPAAAIEFYTSHFECEKAQYNGRDAVRAGKVWLLFNKVDQAPPSDLVSAIWHIGWGAEDMKAAYQKQLDQGTIFQTQITDISGLAGRAGFYYAYVDGPDHALIELNTSNHHHFGHLHLFSADPIAAGEFYIKNFGAKGRGSGSREARFYKGFQVAPAMSLMSDDVNIIIFPIEHARQNSPEFWKGRSSFAPTAGRVIDHIAFSVPDLNAAVERLKANGIAVKANMVDGPDGVSIELVEARAQ
jgi:catechol 2,3-dioxygenase-like lactoylglutathione lyase family enzyme